MADVPVTWLAIREDQKAFEEQQLRALRAAFPDLAEAAPAQLGIFFHYCKASGLDPFGRQIYMIKRKSRGEIRWTIQTGIDGYRLIARRAADRSGQPIAYEDFVWYDVEGGEHTVWLRDEPPAACKCVVWRGDSRFSAVAHWREYAPKVWDYEAQDYKLGGLWPQMPASQLAKVAEALVLRRACPADLLSGLRVDEEMHAADAAESRERVDTAVAELRDRTEKTPVSTEGRVVTTPAADTAQQDVTDAEVVDPPVPPADRRAVQQRPAEPRKADEPELPSPLESARREVVHVADALGIPYGEVNDTCFDLNAVSYQDATAEQLKHLAQHLAGADEPGEAEPSNGQRKRTSAKKSTAKKTTPRQGTQSKTATGRKTMARATARGAK
ncbi:recombinase RecT [Streptomyces sp900129855]|uniref:Recombinase RecT n=1 Tax=Streptomyces sp. 900129855 TaxID=3155129 RepID=A0ABV2ZLF6_9ACTN